MQVLRCDLDGSNVEALVVAGEGDDSRDARNHCVGIAVDTTDRMIYWSQKGRPTPPRRIFGRHRHPSRPLRIDRDDIETLWAALPEPIDLHLANDGHWCGRIEEPSRSAIPSNRARVKPDLGSPQVCSRGYDEAIGLTTAMT